MLSTVLATSWRRIAPLTACLCAVLLTVGCVDDEVDYEGNYGNPSNPDDIDPPKKEKAKWEKFQPEGAECADGTPYKYFVKKRPESDNVLVIYEGGGACWNYETCTAAEGSLGALGVNCVLQNRDRAPEDKIDCIADNYADTYYALPDTISDAMFETIEAIVPDWVGITNRRVAIDTVIPYASAGYKARDSGNRASPMYDWNLVFVPYCTADLYAGLNETTYSNPDASDSYDFKHVGLRNVEIVAEELNEMFPKVTNFAMNGCSAGGVGVLATYPFYRHAMKGIENGYVFSDAGPLFPTEGDLNYPAHSKPLHDTVLEAWNIGAMFDNLLEHHEDIAAELGYTGLPSDVSEMYRFMSHAFPDDRFNISHTQTDYNYSLYSYTSFYGLETRANNAADAKTIYQYWYDDNNNLIDRLDELDNFGYYMPYWRRTNDSHCISIVGVEDIDAKTGDEVNGLLGLMSDPFKNYYAGTEIPYGDEEDEYYNYRDVAVNLLDNSQEPMREVGLDSEYMGLRKYCTPPFLKEDGGQGAIIPDSDNKCSCAFGEYDDVDTDRGAAICGCFESNQEAGRSACECAVDALEDALANAGVDEESELDDDQKEALDAAREACF